MLDGAIRATFASAMSWLYLDATLHRATLTDDGEGGGSVGFADEAVKAQLDQTTMAQRTGEHADTEQRIIVLAEGVNPIKTDDEITVAGTRWGIVSVSQDPARSYYDLAGRRA